MWIRNLVVTTVLAAGVANSQAIVSEKTRARIAREVRLEILMLPYFDVFDNIELRVDGSTVTLTGHVTKPAIKSEADAVIRNIEGVETIVNQIVVLPPSPDDDHLRMALYRVIYGFGSLQRYAMPVIKPIRIIVMNGNVTLEGVVNSVNDRNLARLRANGVPGVLSVTNNLRVEEHKSL